MNPYAQKPSRPSGMSALDYHSWLYGEDGGYIANTSTGYKVQLEASANPSAEITFTTAEVYRLVEYFTPKKIIRNGPATIVMWPDNTKTVVKCSEGENDNTYTAFCAALAQKIFVSNSKIKKMVSKLTEEQA